MVEQIERALIDLEICGSIRKVKYEEQEAVIKVDGDVYTLVLDQDDAKIEFGLNFKTFDYNFKLTSEELIMSGSQVTDKDGRKNINLLDVE